MDGRVRMSGDDIIHEVEELNAPPALLVRGRHLASGYFEGGEQRRGAVAFVIVAMSGQRSTVRKLQISLRPLQRLDRGLFVEADDDGVLGRRHVEPDHVGSLGDELGIVALALGFAPGKVDPSAHAGSARYTGHRPAQQPAMAPSSGHNPWAALDPIASGCVCSSPPYTSARRPDRPFRRDPQAASRHSGLTTSRPYRSCIQLRVQSPDSLCRSQIKARSEPACRRRCSVLLERAKRSRSARSSIVKMNES
jgi:hypothetical protein